MFSWFQSPSQAAGTKENSLSNALFSISIEGEWQCSVHLHPSKKSMESGFFIFIFYNYFLLNNSEKNNITSVMHP